MPSKHIGPAIRAVLTLALLYGVYTETGLWTTLTLALMAIGQEVHAALWWRSR